MASSRVKPSSPRSTSRIVSAIEKSSRAGGTVGTTPVRAATYAWCATEATRGQRPSMDSATSTSCTGLVSSGLLSNAYSKSVARCSTFMMDGLNVVRGKMRR